MNSSRSQILAPRLINCSVVIILAVTGCDRTTSKQQKTLRAEFGKAMRDLSYTKAADVAQQLLKLNRQDNGSWDRVVQAQFGLRDFDGVKQTLEDWRRTMPKASPKLDEYTGDLAIEENNPAHAVEAWTKVLSVEPKNSRVLEKTARAERAQQHWNEENARWSDYINLQDNAMARVQRALCRRRLSQWEGAFDDLKRAQELAPGNPDVQRANKLFERMRTVLSEIRAIDAALAVTPNDPGLLADRALLFLRTEDYERALEDSKEATRVGPWGVRPKLFQAIALIALGRADECAPLAVGDFIRLASLTPEFLETISRLDSEISVERSNAELYVARAWQLNEIKQPWLAADDAENAVRLDPKSAGACAEYGFALMKVGRAVDALQQIMRATELDVNSATAWQYRGELEMERGETLSAIDSFTHALERNQTVTALQKREACYRRLGLLVKAEEDRRALEELNTQTPK
ncbi:MAG TPA: hypothetical protein VFD18_08515 [Chthoniobacterales bacterium]|nr:hypothetical protein [Chthoniobacterales bacterium]